MIVVLEYSSFQLYTDTEQISKVGKQMKRCKAVIINISKLKAGVKYSISRRTTLFLNPYLAEETNYFPFSAPPWYGLNWTT